MNLDELTTEEENLIQRISSIKGTIELLMQELKRNGVFDAYAKLHREYVELAVKSSELEALKRAIFIQWYALAEPSFNSGIRDLDGSSEQAALAELQCRVHDLKIDKEFEWMLNCYYKIIDSFIIPRDKYKELITYLESMPPWDSQIGSEFSFERRGAMGDYWLSRNDV